MRERHARGETPSPLACLLLACSFFLVPTTSERLLRRLRGGQRLKNAEKTQPPSQGSLLPALRSSVRGVGGEGKNPGNEDGKNLVPQAKPLPVSKFPFSVTQLTGARGRHVSDFVPFPHRK